MSGLSLHDVAMRTYEPMMTALRHVLGKGAAHAASGAAAEAELVAARLAPDMFPLPMQVGIACDHVKGSLHRLAGREVPSLTGEMESFGAMIARVDRTMELAREVPAEALEGSDDREIVLKIGGGDWRFTGRDYLIGFAIPNFYFHVTTAYDLLRMKGVPLGKRDFFGAPQG